MQTCAQGNMLCPPRTYPFPSDMHRFPTASSRRRVAGWLLGPAVCASYDSLQNRMGKAYIQNIWYKVLPTLYLKKSPIFLPVLQCACTW